MGNVSEVVEKDPWAIFAAITVVALLAYLSSRNRPATVSDTTFTGGGISAPPMDPNEAAIEQARISAGQANIGTLASLVLGSEQTSAASSVAIAGSRASQEVADRQIDASQDVTNQQTAASVSIAGVQADTQLRAATLTAQIQAHIAQMSAEAEAKREQDAYQLQLQTLANQKSIARAADNTSLVSGLFQLGGTIASFFFL